MSNVRNVRTSKSATLENTLVKDLQNDNTVLNSQSYTVNEKLFRGTTEDLFF